MESFLVLVGYCNLFLSKIINNKTETHSTVLSSLILASYAKRRQKVYWSIDRL